MPRNISDLVEGVGSPNAVIVVFIFEKHVIKNFCYMCSCSLWWLLGELVVILVVAHPGYK